MLLTQLYLCNRLHGLQNTHVCPSHDPVLGPLGRLLLGSHEWSRHPSVWQSVRQSVWCIACRSGSRERQLFHHLPIFWSARTLTRILMFIQNPILVQMLKFGMSLIFVQIVFFSQNRILVQMLKFGMSLIFVQIVFFSQNRILVQMLKFGMSLIFVQIVIFSQNRILVQMLKFGMSLIFVQIVIFSQNRILVQIQMLKFGMSLIFVQIVMFIQNLIQMKLGEIRLNWDCWSKMAADGSGLRSRQACQSQSDVEPKRCLNKSQCRISRMPAVGQNGLRALGIENTEDYWGIAWYSSQMNQQICKGSSPRRQEVAPAAAPAPAPPAPPAPPAELEKAPAIRMGNMCMNLYHSLWFYMYIR